jgi:carboxypeptidase C (cathepsin A)
MKRAGRRRRSRPRLECPTLPIFAATKRTPTVRSLQNNIEMHFYTSGHMVYAHEPDLKALHANVAAFIDKTRNSSGKVM